MLRADMAQVYDGTLTSAAAIWIWLGSKWGDANKNEGLRDTDRDYPLLATAIALRQRYEWAVALGFDGSPTIRFATDPTGVKELWKVRDLPEGRDRRPALHTWITDHWRRDRYDPDMEVYVRRHLRGATEFTWRDMVGEILPSQFDMERRDKLVQEREAMRIAGIGHRAKA